MKNYLSISLFLLILFNCSKSDFDSNGDDNQNNNAPTVPQLIFPTNNLLCSETILELQWTQSLDPDGDFVTYLLEVSENINFSPLSFSFNLSTNSKTIDFENGTRYYWRVRAVDTYGGESSYSDIYEFYTEGESVNNYLPFSPDLVFPLNNSTTDLSETSLEWESSDLDFDLLNYTVLLGTNNPPTEMVAEEINESSLLVQLTSNGTYYWRIAVKDDKQAVALGQIWSFRKE